MRFIRITLYHFHAGSDVRSRLTGPPYGLLIGQQHQRLPDRPKKYPPEAI